MKLLKRRSISTYIKKLTSVGTITTSIYNGGHYGRTKRINLNKGLDLIEEILVKRDKIKEILNYTPVFLQRDKAKFKNNIFKKLI